MTKRLTILALLVAFITVDADAQNRKYRRRGALLGGLAGAAIGAAIGDKGDNETAGALIGGAVGAVAGGTIGNQKDRRIEHNYRYHNGQRYYVRPQPVTPISPYSTRRPSYYTPHVYPQAGAVIPTEPVTRPVLLEEVIAMVRSGLSEPMVIQQIQMRGVSKVLSVSEVIHLHRSGVSEPIINAMQTAAAAIPTQAAPVESATQFEVPTTPATDPYGPSVLEK